MCVDWHLENAHPSNCKRHNYALWNSPGLWPTAWESPSLLFLCSRFPPTFGSLKSQIRRIFDFGYHEMVSLGDPWELDFACANSWGPFQKSIKFRYRFWCHFWSDFAFKMDPKSAVKSIKNYLNLHTVFGYDFPSILLEFGTPRTSILAVSSRRNAYFHKSTGIGSFHQEHQK